MSKFLSLIVFIGAQLDSEVIDGIAGIVGDKVITQSRVEEAMLLSREPESAKVLEQLIEHELLLVQAEKETLEVEVEELEDAVEDAILKVRGRFPTDEEYEVELKRAGMSEGDLREKYRKEIRENLLIQKLFQKKFGRKLAVSDLEVIDFYNTHRDSIPFWPDAVRFLGVDVRYKISSGARDAAKSRAEEIMERIKKGKASFSELAKKYSDDPLAGETGGNLGFMNPMDLAKEFQPITVNMVPGEIGLVSTDDAYHIIRCNEKYEELINLSDIVIKIYPTQADSEAAKEVIESVKESLKKEESVEIPNAKIISWGEGFIPLSATPFASLESIEIGEVYTFATPSGFEVIKPLETREERMPTWKEIRDEIKQLVYQRKLQRHYEKLINKLKEEVFVKIMP